MLNLAAELRLPTDGLDYTILAIYFVVGLGIGFAARRSVRTSLDFFLSGRSLPAWVTGLAFIAANPGATEILGRPRTARSTASAPRTGTGSAPSRPWSSWAW